MNTDKNWVFVRSQECIDVYKGDANFLKNRIIKTDGIDGVWNIELDLIKKIGKTKDLVKYEQRQEELNRLNFLKTKSAK